MKRNTKKQAPSATEVLHYVLKHKRSFPWPDDNDEGPLDDLPEECRAFHHDAFISVSKTWFARYCGVAGGQVSRWLIAGMPARPDGRLNLWQVDTWLDEYRAEDPDKRKPRH